MEVQCRFSGCSCGCTQSDSATFKGSEPDIYTAIAKWAKEYMTGGSNPFRKLNIPEKSQEILLTWSSIRDESDILALKKGVFIKKINAYEEAAKTLGVDVPDEKLREINANKEIIAEIDRKLPELSAKMSVLFAYDEVSVIYE